MGDETLLERILSGDEDPNDLPLALLKSITNDFSDDRKIGQGGFGAVYKGELQNGIIVAVKRIEVNQITIDDVSFRREFYSLMNTNHQNVVRFLGFCSNTHQTSRKEAGEINLVSVRERLLCFEYIRNGSLDKHITDELRGLEWEPRYAIISGICKGLFYLHGEKNFVHMDLKPPNILLDDHMFPKITDFGLSRSNEMSHTTGQRFGTPGYVAPEYEKDGKTSFKCDIYSLGVIITELVTGRKSVPHKNNVLRRWRHRWNKPPTLLQYRQVTRCIEISVRCRQQESGHRPSILEIVNILGESESMDGHTGQESAYLDDDMLRIEPLELKLNEEMSWSVKLTNKTKASFAFNIERPSLYTIWPDKGIVTPGCNEYLVQITLQPQQRAPQVTQNADKIIFQSTKVPEGLRDEDITENIFHEEAGKVVDEVDLMIVYEPTKPKENCKSREDTNMPAEEVPEAKRRKIVESAFGKGKLGSSEKAEAASMAERIVGSLEDSTKDLIAKKNDVCQKIKNAEREGKKSTNEVDRWLEKVAKIIDVVRVISLDCKLKKDVTMEASEKLREVQECLSSCPSTVAIESMPPPVQEMPGPSMSAENRNLQDALRYIKDEPTVGMIGIWGPGGVGKTHLLRSINNSFGDGMTFDFVLFVTASRGCLVEKVQSQIIERLRLQSTGSERLTIYEYMKTKSFLVLLDDLWDDEIDLEDVGIPYPLGSVNNLNRKVVLTTRLRKVCGRMNVKKELKVAYLQEHEAWQLFKENIGAETLSSPHIEDLARKLVKELKGLPLALITIGKAMYQKNEYQWETAIQYMKQSCCADDEDPIELRMETNVFKKLKFSYDNLRNKTLRDCFLTCVLWPEDAIIRAADLAQCWIGLGLVNGPDIESSFRKSYNLIADLTAACLLDGYEYDDAPGLFRRSYGRVKVHDVIRDMALWISCDCGEKNDKWIVAAPGGRDQKVIMLSNNVECISLMSITIPIRFNLDPLNLRILCLPYNRLDESIFVEAIKNCSSLTYLDLRGNKLKRIPEELFSLVKLEYLDLSETSFYGIDLPHSFGKLINLKFLYLESISDLRIPAGVISSLKALQVIDLRGYILRKPSLHELGTLPQLKALGAEVRGRVELESLLGEAANLPVRYLNMQSVGADLTGILSTDFAQRTLYDLDIEDGDTREITVETRFGALKYLRLFGMKSLREIMWMGATPTFIFPRLTCLELLRTRLSHLSWAMYLPCLEELCIHYCSDMVQAFMRCHGDKLCNGQDKTKTFPCLRFLSLHGNFSLEAIGDKGMEFPSLERLEIQYCPKLKRLPFQLDSLPPKLKELCLFDAEDWERLECEQGVKTFLQPLLELVPPETVSTDDSDDSDDSE